MSSCPTLLSSLGLPLVRVVFLVTRCLIPLAVTGRSHSAKHDTGWGTVREMVMTVAHVIVAQIWRMRDMWATTCVVTRRCLPIDQFRLGIGCSRIIFSLLIIFFIFGAPTSSGFGPCSDTALLGPHPSGMKLILDEHVNTTRNIV